MNNGAVGLFGLLVLLAVAKILKIINEGYFFGTPTETFFRKYCFSFLLLENFVTVVCGWMICSLLISSLQPDDHFLIRNFVLIFLVIFLIWLLVFGLLLVYELFAEKPKTEGFSCKQDIIIGSLICTVSIFLAEYTVVRGVAKLLADYKDL
ncbi:MAG: hypothetical protein WC087_01495 [Candidatus Paceibacterota bacterium]